MNVYNYTLADMASDYEISGEKLRILYQWSLMKMHCHHWAMVGSHGFAQHKRDIEQATHEASKRIRTGKPIGAFRLYCARAPYFEGMSVNFNLFHIVYTFEGHSGHFLPTPGCTSYFKVTSDDGHTVSDYPFEFTFFFQVGFFFVCVSNMIDTQGHPALDHKDSLQIDAQRLHEKPQSLLIRTTTLQNIEEMENKYLKK